MKSKDFLKEGFVEDAAASFQDHEVQMARKDCFMAAENALALHKLLKNVSEVQGIEGWVAAKITLASDYLNTVREYLEYELMSGQQEPVIGNKLPIAEGRVKQVEADLEELTSQEFKKKYNLTKEEARKALKMPEKADSAKQDMAEDKEDLSKYSTERLKAYVEKVSGGGVPAFGSGAQLKRVQAELKRREQQGVAEELTPAQKKVKDEHRKLQGAWLKKKSFSKSELADLERREQELRAKSKEAFKEADNPALGVDQMTGKEKLRPHTGVGPKPGTLKHKLGKMAHTAKSAADYLRGKPERMGHLEENTAGSVATVNNPESSKPKSQVGSLFGGSYGEPKTAAKKIIKR
jgi:hypothetical protein